MKRNAILVLMVAILSWLPQSSSSSEGVSGGFHLAEVIGFSELNQEMGSTVPCATGCEVNYSGRHICAQRTYKCMVIDEWVTSTYCTTPLIDEQGIPCKRLLLPN